SEEGLNALPDSKFQDIRNTGALAAIYAHMVSLMNWQRVIQRTMRRLSTETAS
ncbi:MAG TPA: SapC family protein, partial [Hyphomonadaceae bacterium]|nr:SapC family protein [Hyphomonadaceae bacterium]